MYTLDLINLYMAAPLLALAVGATLVLTLDLILPAKQGQPYWFLTGIAAIGLAGWYVAQLWPMGTVTAFSGALISDRFSLVFGTIILGATLLTLLLSVTRQEQDQSGYLSLVLFAGTGMLMLVGAGNLATLFMGLELFSLALYVVVGFAPNNMLAREAAFKYFSLGAVAAAFLLFGFAFLYGATGSISLKEIAQAAPNLLDNMLFKAGVGLTLVGFLFKMALVPFHVWAPDVYQGAPSAITAFMSVGTKTAAFAALARVLVAVVPDAAHGTFIVPVAVAGALSMLLGSLVALKQTNLKRLLAYSGIAHAGYLTMALSGLSPEGFAAGAYYLIAYGVGTMGLFALIISEERKGYAGDELSHWAGMYYRQPAKAAAMTIFLFGMAGLPPAGGFVGKLLLGMEAVATQSWLLLGALALSTGISAFVYLKVVGVMFRKVEAPAVEQVAAASDGSGEEPLALGAGLVRNVLIAVVAIGVAGTLFLGVVPGPVAAFTQGLLGK